MAYMFGEAPRCMLSADPSYRRSRSTSVGRSHLIDQGEDGQRFSGRHEVGNFLVGRPSFSRQTSRHASFTSAVGPPAGSDSGLDGYAERESLRSTPSPRSFTCTRLRSSSDPIGSSTFSTRASEDAISTRAESFDIDTANEDYEQIDNPMGGTMAPAANSSSSPSAPEFAAGSAGTSFRRRVKRNTPPATTPYSIPVPPTSPPRSSSMVAPRRYRRVVPGASAASTQ